MEVVTAQFVSQKKVLLRYDIDVPIQNGRVIDDFRLKAGLATLKLCLDNALEVTMIGHVGRPEGEDLEFSVAPIYQWFLDQGFKDEFESGKLKLLENLRFELGEDQADLEYAKELASYGDVYVNEAFAAFHKASSTTVLPTFLPSVAGLNFAKEVETLTKVKNPPAGGPQKPLIVIMGGAKVEDKLPLIFSQKMAHIVNEYLIGGKLVQEIKEQNIGIFENASLGKLTEDGLDITIDSIKEWAKAINQAGMIVWNGPMGKIEDENYQKGTRELAMLILESEAEVIVGGGDTVGFLSEIGLLEKFKQKGLVSTGGGAMLKFLSEGTLPTIEALD